MPASTQYASRPEKTIIWNHPAEVHVRDDVCTPEYYGWRHKGITNPVAVRYQVLFSLTDDGRRLNYIEARKEIYFKVPEYYELL